MALELSTAFKNLLLNNLFLASGLSPMAMTTLNIRTGAKPGVNNALTGTSLYANTGFLGSAKFTNASNGVARYTQSTAAASATGTAGYARVETNVAAPIFEADVGTSSNEVRLNTLSLTAAVNFTVSQLDIGWGDVLGTVKLNSALRNRLVDWLTGVVPASTVVGLFSLEVYKGTMPAVDATPDSGDLLATSNLFDNSVYASASGGAKALIAPVTVNASATGTATWARLGDSASFWIYGTVGTSSADFLLSTTSLVSAVDFDVTNATLSL